jgi:hypothetical protein
MEQNLYGLFDHDFPIPMPRLEIRVEVMILGVGLQEREIEQMETKNHELDLGHKSEKGKEKGKRNAKNLKN